jgi:hypothetical protein
MSMRVPLPQGMVFGKYLSPNAPGAVQKRKRTVRQNTVAGIIVWTLALLSLVAHSTPVRPSETATHGNGRRHNYPRQRIPGERADKHDRGAYRRTWIGRSGQCVRIGPGRCGAFVELPRPRVRREPPRTRRRHPAASRHAARPRRWPTAAWPGLGRYRRHDWRDLRMQRLSPMPARFGGVHVGPNRAHSDVVSSRLKHRERSARGVHAQDQPSGTHRIGLIEAVDNSRCSGGDRIETADMATRRRHRNSPCRR